MCEKLLFYALVIIKLLKMLRFTNILPVFRYGIKASWANAEVHKPFDGKVQNVTLIPGIGIGPEITSSYLFKTRLCIISFSSS